jgi:hypothetical protein
MAPIGIGIGIHPQDIGGWVLGGNPILDLDFINDRGFFNGSFGTSTSFLTISRASTGFIDNNAGVWSSVLANTARRSNKGLLVEEARTNLFVSPAAPATQSIVVVPATTYTVSVIGTGNVVLTDAATGTVSQGNPITFAAASANLTLTTAGITGSFVNVNVEAGSFATSPIQTGTRNNDNISPTVAPTITTTLSAFVQARRLPMGASPVGRFLNINDGTGSQEIRFNSSPSWQVIDGGATQCNLSNGNIEGNGDVLLKMAGRAVANDFQAYFNGVATAHDVVGTIPAGQTTFVFGRGSSGYMNGYLHRLTLWLTGVPDLALQAMTT